MTKNDKIHNFNLCQQPFVSNLLHSKILVISAIYIYAFQGDQAEEENKNALERTYAFGTPVAARLSN